MAKYPNPAIVVYHRPMIDNSALSEAGARCNDGLRRNKDAAAKVCLTANASLRVHNRKKACPNLASILPQTTADCIVADADMHRPPHKARPLEHTDLDAQYLLPGPHSILVNDSYLIPPMPPP
nr:hypothetical protein [Devosia ginsengisoli]